MPPRVNLILTSVPTKNSKVRPISRMDLTPAETTAMGVRPSSVRSALMSIAAMTGWLAHELLNCITIILTSTQIFILTY